MQNFGFLGAPITLDECGFYIARNRADGSLNSLFCLRYVEDYWLLYQLKHQPATAETDEAIFWKILGDDIHDALESMPTSELQRWLQRPELQDPSTQNPVGGWQVLRNLRFGFGKFTPADANLTTCYALLRFRDGQMLGPILIEKTNDPAIIELGQLGF
jgi:hypothetical protein